MTQKTDWKLEKSKNTPLEIYEKIERDRKRNEDKWKIFAYTVSEVLSRIESLVILPIR